MTQYVTLEELASHVGVKISTVRQWVKRGFIPRDTYIKAGNTYRFCLDDVVAALRNEEATEEKPTEEAPTEIESMLETAPILEVDKLNQTIAEFDDDI